MGFNPLEWLKFQLVVHPSAPVAAVSSTSKMKEFGRSAAQVAGCRCSGITDLFCPVFRCGAALLGKG